MKYFNYWTLTILTFIVLGVGSAPAQQNLAQQASALFQQHCHICHAANAQFAGDVLIDDHAALMASGTVVSGNPEASSLFQRLLADPPKRMPRLGQPLSAPGDCHYSRLDRGGRAQLGNPAARTSLHHAGCNASPLFSST